MERRFTGPCVFHDDVGLSVTHMDLSTGMSHLSNSLRSESEKYRKAARNINFQAMLRQYAPLAGVVFLIIILLWWRFS